MIKACAASGWGLPLSPVQDLPAELRHDSCAVVRSRQCYGDIFIKRSIIAKPTIDCFSVEINQQIHSHVCGVVKRMDG